MIDQLTFNITPFCKSCAIYVRIQKVLLEERAGESGYDCGQYSLKWTLANDLDIVFVVVHQKILQLLYLDDLLDAVKEVGETNAYSHFFIR